MTSEPSSVLRLLVVDDHQMVREGLRSMLSGSAAEVAGEAATAEEALRSLQADTPDVIILDMKLPDMDGLAVLRRIKALVPHTPVLIVSMIDDPELVRQAIQAGAAGYLLKGVGRRDLLSAIAAVHAGESTVDPRLMQAVVTTEAGTAETLGPLELDVLRCVTQGMTNKEIAEHLRWSVSNVKKYVQRILEKLEVSDRTEAAVVALRRGLLH